MMDKKLLLAIILTRVIYSGWQILAKAGLNSGLNAFVFVFYRQMLATICLAPIAIISERKRAPSLSFKILCKMFLLASGMAITLNLYSVGLDYTSSALSAAIVNAIPVLTFILSVLLGEEILNMRSLRGIAKVSGVALSLAGVMVMAFYQGPPLKSLNHHHLHLGHRTRTAAANGGSSSSKTWVKGSFLMLLGSVSWSLWLVMQRRLLKEYPSKVIFATFGAGFTAIQSGLVAIFLERDFSRWRLGPDVRLVSVAYCGIIVTGVSFYLQSWCIERAGPVILSMWTPLSFVLTTSFLSFVLGETISAGSLIGGLLMVGGLYCVLLGKSKEQVSSNRLPFSMEDGKEDLEMKRTPLPHYGATKTTSNSDSVDSKCKTNTTSR